MTYTVLRPSPSDRVQFFVKRLSVSYGSKEAPEKSGELLIFMEDALCA